MATTGESRRPTSNAGPSLTKTSSQEAARKVSMELKSSNINSPEEKSKKRNIHVTAKYNRKQMRLRLNIEEWMDGQLRILYECEEDEDYPVEIDIDALLEESEDRFKFVEDIISDVRKPKETFIRELLQKIEVL